MNTCLPSRTWAGAWSSVGQCRLHRAAVSHLPPETPTPAGAPSVMSLCHSPVTPDSLPLLLFQPLQHLPLPRDATVPANSGHQLLRGSGHGRPGQHTRHLPGGGQQWLRAHVCVRQPGCRQLHQQRVWDQQQQWQWQRGRGWRGRRSRHLRDPRRLRAGQCQPVLLPHHPCLASHGKCRLAPPRGGKSCGEVVTSHHQWDLGCLAPEHLDGDGLCGLRQVTQPLWASANKHKAHSTVPQAMLSTLTIIDGGG